MRTPQVLNSFRARLILLLVALLGLTLGVQYYVNVRSVRRNAHMLVEQEQAIMAGVALGVNSISSGEYLDKMQKEAKQPLLDQQAGRVKNVLVVDSEGNVQDSLNGDYAPTTIADGSTKAHFIFQSRPPRAAGTSLSYLVRQIHSQTFSSVRLHVLLPIR
jgi:hypothetical protein